jgi:hypothetical protein
VIGPLGKSGAAKPNPGQRTKKAKEIRTAILFIQSSFITQAPIDFFPEIKEEEHWNYYIKKYNQSAMKSHSLLGKTKRGPRSNPLFFVDSRIADLEKLRLLSLLQKLLTL